MFRTVSIIVLLATIGAVALHCLVARLRSPARAGPIGIARGLVYLLTLLFLPQQLTLLGKFKKLLYLLAMLCVLVLAVTGFYPVLILGKHISGYLLMIHVTAGGVFAACLALLALAFAHSHRFNENDWPWLTSLVRRELQKPKVLPEDSDLLRKLCFWLLIILALLLMLSVVLSMFPLLGTVGQLLLADTHRYSTLAFAAVAIIHTYLIIRAPTRK
ncbi:MAG: cytochrome b/b6 domain-containing protein [Planctomycetota bacterium]|jgi:cytochrome b subunit of formate dehydrogenase